MSASLKAVLSLVSFPSDDPKKSADFFAKLLGIDFVQALADQEVYHAPISDDGIDFNITARHSPKEGVTAYLGVRDLDATVAAVKQMGGQVVWGPSELKIPAAMLQSYKDSLKKIEGTDVQTDLLCKAAVVVDPGNTQVGLVEVAEHAKKHFAVGKFYRPLSDDRVMVHNESERLARQSGKRVATS